MKFLHQNISGVPAQGRKQAQIIGISETHLNRNILDEGLNTQRKDRPDGKGGRIVVCIAETLTSHRRFYSEADGIEGSWIEVLFNKSRSLLGSYTAASRYVRLSPR